MKKRTTVSLIGQTISRAKDLMKFYSHNFSGLVAMLIDREWERINK